MSDSEQPLLPAGRSNQRDYNSTQQREEDFVLSLDRVLGWIKEVKGDNVQIRAAILATALKIRGSLNQGNVCAVPRVQRENENLDSDVTRAQSNNLTGVGRDAVRMQHYFTSIRDNHVVSIPVIQRPNEGKEEMMASVNDAFRDGDADVIFLYYTGHGCRPNGNWTIPKKDDEPGFDAISLSEIKNHWIATKEHRKPDTHLIIIADSWYSEAWVNKIDEERHGAFRDANISMVASCRANEETCYDGQMEENLQ